MSSPPVILAIASPPGRSLRGIIRLSGAETFALLQMHLHLEDAGDGRAHKMHRARLHLLNHDLPILAMHFRARQSYTGEDTAELQLPGNLHLLARVIDALLESARARNIDARRAEPGEFTARAFLNGRLSLTQAEGVAATIAAQSDAELRAARLLTGGALGEFAHTLAEDIASALALVEAGIDFTDQEDVIAIAPRELHDRLINLRARIADHLRRAVGMEQLSAIPWVVLAGAPNAGKSSLFNALLGHERAVVSPMAGTTRDVLAEPLAIPTDHGPAEVMLVDLAGLDDVDASPMNTLMQAAAGAALVRAELIIRCVPVDGPEAVRSIAASEEIIVQTKCDLQREQGWPGRLGRASLRTGETPVPPMNHLCVSAITGEGLAALKAAIAARLADRAVSLAADAMALRPRHEAALRAALANLEEAIGLVAAVRDQRSLREPELIAASMRAALDNLAALAGDITPDEVLGRIFATFCVGK